MGLLSLLTSRLGVADPIETDRLGERYEELRRHVLGAATAAEPGTEPFRHCYIEQVFPDWFYGDLMKLKRGLIASGRIRARTQDNATFVNRRSPLANATAPEARMFRALFEDDAIRRALLSKFYLDVGPELLGHVGIHHDEFEFVFCAPDLFQNIHVDIPPKYLSFVFYFPSGDLTPEEEDRNATLLYDRDLEPVYGAKFRPNSVCVFAPHFHSYHGFSTTVPRDVIVMFLVNRKELKRWNRERTGKGDTGPDFSLISEMTETKLRRFPLIEYGRDHARIAEECERTQINAPQGRVMLD